MVIGGLPIDSNDMEFLAPSSARTLRRKKRNHGAATKLHTDNACEDFWE
jgi:hypothetical protein